MTSAAAGRIGVLTGLASERQALNRGLEAARGHHGDTGLELLFACAGADARRARRCAEDLIAEGAERLVSFGIAGGLDPSLGPGTLLLPEAVSLASGKVLDVHAGWRERLVSAATDSGVSLAGGHVAGRDQMLVRVHEKQALHWASGASAVDMESHAVAEVAQAAGLPFLVLRAVADPAGRALPSLVKDAIDPDGRPRTARVIARLSLQPWRLPDLLRLRRDSDQALTALERLVQTAGPALFSRG